jgi:phosphoglycolate phosphatase-like HAD superfamily hydrolase
LLNLGFPVSSVILDLDGTIFDSKKVYRKVLKRALNSSSDSFLSQFYFSTLEENCSKSILGLREKLDNLIYVFFEQIDVQKPKMFKGAKEFLEKLNESNIKIFASTGSTIGKAERMMKKADIFKFFELVLGREIPKVKHICFFAKHLNMGVREFSHQAIYIGDEPMDMILAKRFGIYGIGITNTCSSQLLKKFGAEKIINNFKELIEI